MLTSQHNKYKLNSIITIIIWKVIPKEKFKNLTIQFNWPKGQLRAFDIFNNNTLLDIWQWLLNQSVQIFYTTIEDSSSTKAIATVNGAYTTTKPTHCLSMSFQKCLKYTSQSFTYSRDVVMSSLTAGTLWSSAGLVVLVVVM